MGVISCFGCGSDHDVDAADGAGAAPTIGYNAQDQAARAAHKAKELTYSPPYPGHTPTPSKALTFEDYESDCDRTAEERFGRHLLISDSRLERAMNDPNRQGFGAPTLRVPSADL